jgi:deazaflavin-dependent oxidoreductase (nitroreductase family)
MKSRIVDHCRNRSSTPLDKLAFALRTPLPGDALLETIGRRTGQPRVTPVCDCLEGSTFWIVAQRGRCADFVKNIDSNPHVRVKGSLSGTAWRDGTARILDDDDPKERVKILSRGNPWRRLCLQTSASIATTPVTIRIDLDSQ